MEKEKEKAVAKKRQDLSDETEISLLSNATGTAVSLVAFLSAIAFFFSGLLLTGDGTDNITKSVSLSLLFAAAFGFLFAALFYSNSAGKYMLGIIDKKQISKANIISEYFGVYGLVFATPLAIYSYSGDAFMTTVVFLLASLGIFVYQTASGQSSVVERYFSERAVLVITLFLIFAAALQILSAVLALLWLFYIGTAFLWITILSLTFISWQRNEDILE
jgi:hypothetical protein